MIDIKQEAEKLLEYAGISATQRDIDFAADALRSFAERWKLGGASVGLAAAM